MEGAAALERLIPQRPPIVMIEKLLSSDDAATTTSLRIRAENIFCENGRLTEPGLIENMAQTAAARAGYAAAQAGAAAPIGFIGAVEQLSIHALPEVGSEITTTVRVEHQVLHISRISATVRSGADVIAQCTMKIALAATRAA